MKRIICVVSSLLCSYYSYSQVKINEYKKMLDSAIVLQIKQLQNMQNETYLIDENDRGYVFLQADYQKKFKYINIYDTRNKKLLKNGISAWKVLSRLENNKLMIRIVDFSISFRNSNYDYKNGGGAEVLFEYSCSQNKWVLLESKWVGN